MFFHEIFDEHLKVKKIKYSIQYIEKVKSTNQYAWSTIIENTKNIIVIFTKNQTNGKGQRNNKWFSTPNKSLTFSLVLNTNKKYEELLSLKTGIAVVEGIRKVTGIDCHLKWPNDIIFNEKKIGGILIEKRSKKIVVGIGINVNENLKNLNSLINKKSTSLKIISNSSIQLEKLLANILNEFEFHYHQTNSQNIIKMWKENCRHINQNIKFHQSHKIISGKFVDLSNDGSIIVNIKGKNHVISGGIVNL